MTLANILTLVSVGIILLLNIGGWVWFFATLKAQVMALAAQQVAFAQQLSMVPKDFMPREQIVALFSSREALDEMHRKRVDEIHTDVKQLLRHWIIATEPQAGPHRH